MSPMLCENERGHSILNSEFKKNILSSIKFLFISCIVEDVFQMSHKQLVLRCSLTPTLAFDIELVVYNLTGTI